MKLLRAVAVPALLAVTLAAPCARAMDIPDLVFPESAISKVEPAAAAPGTEVTIRGLNFVAGTRVWLGGTEATDVKVVSSDRLVATVPQHAPGKVSVMVRLPMFREASRGWSFTYLP